MAAIICPKKEDCDRERDIIFKLRDNTNMRSEEVPCKRAPAFGPACPASFRPPPSSHSSYDDELEPPCQNFKKRDIANMISEEIPCSKAAYRRAVEYPCKESKPESCPVASAPAGPPQMDGAMEAMVCIKVKKGTKTESGETKGKKADKEKSAVKPSKSRELRAGILFVGCDCEKRNGLQDDCQRTGCHGSPECLTKPNPICPPSEFSNGKHLLKKGHKKLGGRGGAEPGGKTGGKAGGDSFGDYQCFPAILQKICCGKC